MLIPSGIRPPSHRSRLWQWGLLPTMASVVLALSGCQGMTVTGLRESAQVRVIQASPDAPPLDLYLGENALAYNLAFGARTTYVPVSQGNYLLHADVAGTRQALGTTSSALLAGRQYTAIVGDSLGSLRLLLLPDQAHPAPAGEAALRLVDQAFRSGPLEVYLVPSGSTPASSSMLPAMNFGAVESYRNIAAGSYSLTVLPAGAAPGSGLSPLFTGPQMSLASGSVRTIVLLDRTGVRAGGEATVQAVVNEEGSAAAIE